MPDANETPLLPCPFCGGEPVTVNMSYMRTSGEVVLQMATGCLACGVPIIRPTLAEAIAAWNTRKAGG